MSDDGLIIRTSHTTVCLPWDAAKTLLDRLAARDDGKAAVNAIENRTSAGAVLTQQQQLIVHDTIDAWMLDEGAEALGAEIMSLRDELKRDLGMPPFRD